MDSLHLIWLEDPTAWHVGDYLLMPIISIYSLRLETLGSHLTVGWRCWKDRLSKRHHMET